MEWNLDQIDPKRLNSFGRHSTSHAVNGIDGIAHSSEKKYIVSEIKILVLEL